MNLANQFYSRERYQTGRLSSVLTTFNIDEIELFFLDLAKTSKAKFFSDVDEK
jgi:hypothetical protein